MDAISKFFIKKKKKKKKEETQLTRTFIAFGFS